MANKKMKADDLNRGGARNVYYQAVPSFRRRLFKSCTRFQDRNLAICNEIATPIALFGCVGWGRVDLVTGRLNLPRHGAAKATVDVTEVVLSPGCSPNP
jgi:hypothetical protein